MGSTPPNDIVLSTTRSATTPEGIDWWVVRVATEGPAPRDVLAALAGPFTHYAQAAVAWRIAGHYTRPVLVSVEAWTLAHQDGWCGGDKAGCPHCTDIASRFQRWHPDEQQILANRRNLPLGYGQSVWRDPYAAERATRLVETPA